MIYLILAILSSATIAIIMRFAQQRINYPIGLLAGNYIVCSLMALLLSVPELQDITPQVLVLPTGLAFSTVLYIWEALR